MKEITPAELKKKLEQGLKIVLVDVREPYEHEEFNIGGLLIPLADVPDNSDQFKEMGDSEIVLYCRSGNRSSMAQKLLAVKYGIMNTLNLRGGMNAWRDAMRE